MIGPIAGQTSAHDLETAWILFAQQAVHPLASLQKRLGLHKRKRAFLQADRIFKRFT